MNNMRRGCLLALSLTLACAAQAQFRVDVSGVGMQQIPMAFAQFRDEGRAPQQVASIVRADLERSGLFRPIALSDTLDENARPDLGAMRGRGADALLTGSVTRLADGRFDVRYRLWDVVKSQDLGGASFVVVAADLRLASHRIADQIYERLTGEKGVFSTRLAYVTKRGTQFTLWIADSDGENAQAALNSPEPIISPSWSPNGRELAYVSFETRKPVVYVHDVGSGKRRVLANFKGSNSAPAWSPDGRSLAVTLSREGGSQIFLIPSAGGEPQRLTQSSSIDTEPVFSPDGSAVYFVSDRGGSPQIYRTPARGGPVQRVTFNGTYNISPSLSPDGRWLAYVSRVSGQFKLHLMDLQTEKVTAITETGADERPSFAPNSRLLVYATQVQGREALMTTTLDGKITARLAGQSGDIREPHWGPFHP
ncbi:MAG: translocation protein TolB [Pseudomonadota bacterium]